LKTATKKQLVGGMGQCKGAPKKNKKTNFENKKTMLFDLMRGQFETIDTLDKTD